MKTTIELQAMIDALRINMETEEGRKIESNICPEWSFRFMPDNKIIVECKYVSKHKDIKMFYGDNDEPGWREEVQHSAMAFEFESEDLDTFVEEVNNILFDLLFINLGYGEII